jgi:hypothetical protein
MDRFKHIIPILLVVLAVGFITGQFTSTDMSGIETASGLGTTHEGYACIKVIRKDGTVEDYGCKHNYFMDEGKLFIADQIDTTTADTDCIDYMFLGNNTSWGQNYYNHTGTGNGAGEIFDCDLEAASINWVDSPEGTGNLSATHTWTSGCDTIVNTTGLNCSACPTIAEWFAGNNFTTSVTLSSGDQLNVTWHVWSA